MLCCITSKHKVKSSWQSGEYQVLVCLLICRADLQKGSHRCIFVSDFTCLEDFSSRPALKQSYFPSLLLAGCLTFPLYHLPEAWELSDFIIGMFDAWE